MSHPKIIFLVDDDTDDLEFFSEALKEIDPSIKCITSSNGESALIKLKEWTAPFPDFIFLDLNLPRLDGKKCLIEIKKNEAIRHIPVVIYSTSSEQRVVEQTLALGAAHFLSKPSRLSELCDAIKYILTADLTKKQKFVVS